MMVMVWVTWGTGRIENGTSMTRILEYWHTYYQTVLHGMDNDNDEKKFTYTKKGNFHVDKMIVIMFAKEKLQGLLFGKVSFGAK